MEWIGDSIVEMIGNTIVEWASAFLFVVEVIGVRAVCRIVHVQRARTRLSRRYQELINYLRSC